MCKKKTYENLDEARKSAAYVWIKKGKKIYPYRCPWHNTFFLPRRTKERRIKHSIEMKRHYCPTCGALLNPLAYIGRKDQKKRVLYCEYCIETNKPPELYTKTVEIEEPQD